MTTSKTEPAVFDQKLKDDRDYWLARLSAGVTPSNIKLDFERPETRTPDLAMVEMDLHGRLYERLARLTGESTLLVYTALLAALKICLRKYTGEKLVVVGSPALKDSERLNALAICTEIDAEMAVRELLVQLRGRLLEDYERQDYPFARLVENLRLSHIQNRCPLFNIAVSLDSLHGEMGDFGQDITIEFSQEAASLRGRIIYRQGLYKHESMVRFKAHFVKALEKMIEDVSKPVKDVEIMPEAEKREVVEEWNDTRVSYSTACLHELIEQQARLTPEAVAVAFLDQQMSYSELNRRANQVARYLRELGAGPEVRVGICVERSAEMVVGLVGIMKAGGAYVPLEATYPKAAARFSCSLIRGYR